MQLIRQIAVGVEVERRAPAGSKSSKAVRCRKNSALAGLSDLTLRWGLEDRKCAARHTPKHRKLQSDERQRSLLTNSCNGVSLAPFSRVQAYTLKHQKPRRKAGFFIVDDQFLQYDKCRNFVPDTLRHG